MKSKKPSLYDAQEKQIQLQSASFVDFLTRKGVLEDHNIDNERVRKAKKDTAQRAYGSCFVHLEAPSQKLKTLGICCSGVLSTAF